MALEESNNEPLLLVHEEYCTDNDGGERKSPELWWNKVLDLREAKDQILFSLPMIFTNVSYYLIPLTSVMFAGHLGDLEMAAANLANSWAVVSGIAVMVRIGISSFLLEVRPP